MPRKTNKTIPHKRKREGRTNYRKRLNLLKSGLPRLVVRRSNKHIYAQLVSYEPDGDKVTAVASSSELAALGWKGNSSNISASYLVGLLLASKTKTKKAILDLGLHTPISGSKLMAVVKGCVDNGIEIPVDNKSFPPENRITGGHVKEYAEALEKDGKKIQANVPAMKAIVEQFNSVKEKILKNVDKK